MRAWTKRLAFLFGSTKGLVLTAIAAIALTTAIWSTLSGPLLEMGVGAVTARLLGMRLLAVEREGRIIMLYHSIAMAVVAIEVYLITNVVAMKEHWRTTINGTVTVGYLFSLIFGLLFAYFGRNWVFHGLFLFGQSLMFFTGLMLAVVLWPWQKQYKVTDPAYAHSRGGVDLERVAFFAMAVTTLGSVLFGAVPGSYMGNGFESFLAENVIREPSKTALQLAVIGHLHIMLTLIGVALLLVIGRWFDFKGRLHKIAMPLLIIGIIIITAGVWMVVAFEELAHFVIYGGSVFVLMPGALLVAFGWQKMIKEGTASLGKTNLAQKLRALLADPLRFGALWQMVYMNFVTTFLGIFMAVRLDKVIRAYWPAREERIELTGHWHVLSTLMATIILLYYADMAGLKGRARQVFGWVVIIASDLAFAAVALFETKRLYVSEAAQQPLVNLTTTAIDAGLGILMLTLAALMIWRLVDLFRRNGRWAKELAAAEQEVSE